MGELFASHGVVSWDDDSYFLPDLVVIPASESHTDDWAEVQHPLLIIEVLSPSSARHDRTQKRRRCQEAGVPAYWVVDPEQAQVEVWTPAATEPRVERNRLTWHPDGVGEPLTLALPALFTSR
ncbi:MAG: Uma2 family endonuclease [Gemmatimonadetes bacterium]|nr:Uma2 family endonuclease [Gemmatimonadota bacterium]